MKLSFLVGLLFTVLSVNCFASSNSVCSAEQIKIRGKGSVDTLQSSKILVEAGQRFTPEFLPDGVRGSLYNSSKADAEVYFVESNFFGFSAAGYLLVSIDGSCTVVDDLIFPLE